MKRILCVITTVVLMLIVCFFNVSAVEYQKNINVFVDDSYIGYTDVRPFVEENRTLVPVRAVAEKMGAKVLWDDSTQTVTINRLCDKITYQDKEYVNCIAGAVLVIGKKEITINLTDENGLQVFSAAREMDVSAKTVNGRMVIPARFVGYALGYDVTWEDKPDLASKVIYKFIGKQTIDFNLNSENPVYDPVKRIAYEYDKEKYPDTIVVNDVEYPCRKGYDDIIIVDASHGRFEGTKMIDVFPYRWTANNIIIECDDEEYKIDENKTIDENLEVYSRFYTDKVGEKVVFDYGLYFPEFSTLNRVTNFGKRNNENELLDDGLWGYEYVDVSKTYYSIINGFPVVDVTKMYFIDERPYEGYYPGSKQYGWKRNEISNKGHDKNTLLFLNSFLGETGQRIWTMMNDYYTLSGYSYVAPDTEWTKKYVFFDENNKVSFGMPEPLDGIPTNIVEKYGLNVIDNRKVSDSQQLLTLKTDNQVIYIEYGCSNIHVEGASTGYNILFTTIEN
ncbi:MAG: copper amine oxidase N-terminal domain-containing protein [Ruminococcaceae bacterium]|nr:copper amine oxidase N-terminal domain-containing protein [Oscillospiraceae bacterium]